MTLREASRQSVYRRGVILGLSLAEALLILIFMLLLFFTVILVQHAEESEDYRRKAEELNRKVAAAQLILARVGLLDPSQARAEVDEIVEFLAVFRDLREKHYSEEQLRKMLLSIIPLGKPEDLPKDFTRVAWAYAAYVAMEKADVDVPAIVADPRVVVATQTLIKKGYQREQVRRVVEAVPEFGSPAELPTDWKRVAWASRTAERLEKTGVNLETLADKPAVLVALQQLLDKGYSSEQLRDLLAAVPQFGTPADLPKDWSRVAWAALTIDKLEKDGVNVGALAANPALLVALQRLLDDGHTQEQLRELFAALPQFGKPGNLPKDWSRVAWAARTIDRLEKDGVNVGALAANPALFVALQRLLDDGHTQEQLRELFAALPQFGKPGNLPKDWSRVASAARAVASLESARIDVHTILVDPRPFAALQQSIENGYSRDQLRELLEALSVFGGPAELPKDWARVARAAATLDQLQKNGVDVKTLTANSAVLVTIQQLLGKGYTREQLRDLLAAVPLFGSPAGLPKDWAQVARDLATLKRARSGGVDVEDIANNPGPISAIQKAGRDNRSPEPGGPDTQRGNWPPMIPLTEARGYYFDTYSAELKPDFKDKLKDEIVTKILEVANTYHVDVVEVTGNTDEQPIKSRQSNMDQTPLSVLRRNADPKSMRVSDNAGLGLARAVAVVRELMSDRRLRHLTIIPLSASYLVDSSGRLSDGTEPGNVATRRRIEIRLRRAG
jgi:outer membrane protein OmpA-like peptidoglycan-associated protein